MEKGNVKLTGYESLKEAVLKDCNEGEGCFNHDGCNHEFYRYEPAEGDMKKYGDTVCRHVSECSHKYCDKFKWVIDRAKHYADKLGLAWEEVLNSWEVNRNYWYMNYYQDCNQPEIKGDKVRVFNTTDDLLKAIGEKKFRCPACGGISTDPYECNSGLEIQKATKKKRAKICDWKVYGLFGDLGKGTYIYCKDKLKGQTIFTPLSWESEEERLINELEVDANNVLASCPRGFTNIRSMKIVDIDMLIELLDRNKEGN
ncbi:hypothetical protein [Clostridium magnum]|uniref:hypothetical protein n=1 Tax=Clostridium magnum TaxID=33954 RepID=UPI00091770AC|nr:hypothetical protein [Clostridium magnum]SHJ14064.1 hypothetical protein SAMN02745944_05431 [Clostridium magnum DSM 2767]